MMGMVVIEEGADGGAVAEVVAIDAVAEVVVVTRMGVGTTIGVGARGKGVMRKDVSALAFWRNVLRGATGT